MPAQASLKLLLSFWASTCPTPTMTKPITPKPLPVINTSEVTPENLAVALTAIRPTMTENQFNLLQRHFLSAEHAIPVDDRGQASPVVSHYGRIGGALSRQMGVRPKDYHLYWLTFQRDSSSKRNPTRFWILRPNVVAALDLLKWFAPTIPLQAASETVTPSSDPSPLDRFFLDLNAEVTRSLEGSRSERLKRLSKAPTLPEKLNVMATVFRRNPDVVAEVLLRAKGICECCRLPAPFVSQSTGDPYLEVHHRVFLSDGGEDTVENAIALCPNCHREKHFG